MLKCFQSVSSGAAAAWRDIFKRVVPEQAADSECIPISTSFIIYSAHGGWRRQQRLQTPTSSVSDDISDLERK